jgi:hypothetical protein
LGKNRKKGMLECWKNGRLKNLIVIQEYRINLHHDKKTLPGCRNAEKPGELLNLEILIMHPFP